MELKESEIPLFQGRCTLNFKTKMYEKDYCIVNGNLFSFAFCARRECLREEKEEKNAYRANSFGETARKKNRSLCRAIERGEDRQRRFHHVAQRERENFL